MIISYRTIVWTIVGSLGCLTVGAYLFSKYLPVWTAGVFVVVGGFAGYCLDQYYKNKETQNGDSRKVEGEHGM